MFFLKKTFFFNKNVYNYSIKVYNIKGFLNTIYCQY